MPGKRKRARGKRPQRSTYRSELTDKQKYREMVLVLRGVLKSELAAACRPPVTIQAVTHAFRDQAWQMSPEMARVTAEKLQVDPVRFFHQDLLPEQQAAMRALENATAAGLAGVP